MNAPRSETRPRAVALAYGASDAAPRVVAKGHGATAESIIQRARESGVYVHESAELVGLLMHLDLDARIPQSLYCAVAELLAWIYRLEQRATAGSPAERPDKGA